MSPYFTDPFSSSLPYDKLRSMYSPTVIEVVKPINVNAGDAVAWFGQYGGGVSLGIGGEASVGIHAGKTSFEIFGNAIGRLGFQYTVEEENGLFTYTRGAINLPEIALAVAAVYFGWPVIASSAFVAVPATATIIVISAILDLFK